MLSNISEPPLSSIKYISSPVDKSVSAQTAKSPIIPTNEIDIELKSNEANNFDTRAVLDDKTHFAPDRFMLF